MALCENLISNPTFKPKSIMRSDYIDQYLQSVPKIFSSMDYLTSKDFFLPTIMSAFLAYIAWQQMRVNSKKLKLDLYNKRFEIYIDAVRFHQEIISGNLSNETHLKFINSKEASYFLFSDDSEIYKTLDELYSQSFKVTGAKQAAPQLQGSPEVLLKMHYDAQHALSINGKLLNDLQLKLKKYLSM